MTEMFGEAWSPMSVPDLAPDDDDECFESLRLNKVSKTVCSLIKASFPWPRVKATVSLHTSKHQPF